MFNETIDYIRSLYGKEGFIPLHEPRFIGSERDKVIDCIDSTFVSSVGKYVDEFEKLICEYTGSKFAVATTNGTAALHMSLILADVSQDDEVLSQALTFVATANAIKYTGAHPVFLDSASDNLGLCPNDLSTFLEKFGMMKKGFCYNKSTGRRIKACVPMHTFGHPVKLDEILEICNQYNITVIEDAAESLGSFYKGKHTGTLANIAAISFNGNKTITCGGGGMILVQSEELAKRAKHLTTTAKIPHSWKFQHDEIGYNYRLPNLNASLACAQMEMLPSFIENKRETAEKYKQFFKDKNLKFVSEPQGCRSNYWLNSVLVEDLKTRDKMLEALNSNGVMARPIWELMPDLEPYKNCQHTELINAKSYVERIVNIPSSVRV